MTATVEAVSEQLEVTSITTDDKEVAVLKANTEIQATATPVEELPCIRQLTHPVLVSPEERLPAWKMPGKCQPLPSQPAGRELVTLLDSF
ncbi:hypothetical protein TKK_0017628 [Trichogramma kaykai]